MISLLKSRKAMKIRRTTPKPPPTEEELSLDDGDIIAVAPIARSGTFAAVRPPPQSSRDVETLPPPPPEAEEAETPEDELPTERIGVNDVIADLARLSDPMSVPRIRGAIDRATLDEAERWLLALVEARFTVRAILSMGPMNDEAALGILAKMITQRKISLAPARSDDDLEHFVDDGWD